ncbi:alkaline phosphatase family protein [Isosphaeraceae bacterium EP7]
MTYSRSASSMALALTLGLAAFCSTPAAAAEPKPAANAVLVTADGLRWQEVFRGADEALINKEDGGVVDVKEVRRKFWRDTPEARREALMPFFWSTIAGQGQLFGNDDKKSPAHVTNGMHFSYPGYNELLTGSADPRIDTNDKVLNPNVSVLEWLNGKPEFRGKVTAAGSWDLFPYILNAGRSGLPVNAGWEPIAGDSLDETQKTLNLMMGRVRRDWHDCRDDAFTFPVALDQIARLKPRVAYISYGDTDEHAHQGRYDLYLDAIHEFDADMKQLWEELQGKPHYAGSTSLLMTTDHGRGDAPKGWRDHGSKTPKSEKIWVVGLGPLTPPLGERRDVPAVTQSQIASTVAALVGEDYRAAAPKAAPPIADLVRGGGANASR